jgi:hypothetical protein
MPRHSRIVTLLLAETNTENQVFIVSQTIFTMPKDATDWTLYHPVSVEPSIRQSLATGSRRDPGRALIEVSKEKGVLLGDRVIVTKNKRVLGVMNGRRGTV